MFNTNTCFTEGKDHVLTSHTTFP